MGAYNGRGMNNRRKLVVALGAGALAAPFGSFAQQHGKTPRVGVLSPGNPPPNDPFRQAEWFEAGLRELGWKPNSNILIEYRYAAGKVERLPGLAEELVRIPVNAIVARGQTIAAARGATTTIPIVMAADPDPVGNGLVASLARPGGNITGLSSQALELQAKQLQLLRDAVPSLTRVAVLTSANSHNSEEVKRREATAMALKFDLTEFSVNTSEELSTSFSKITEARAGAVLVHSTLWFIDANKVAALALKHRLPMAHNLREFAVAGALFTYGVNFAELHRRSAVFIDKILKGSNPAVLAVEQPTKFELVINLKTAKALGLTIPQSLLLRADEVIQ
jgi:putative tryptophan/tyrosine transport system substrate-binding protein